MQGPNSGDIRQKKAVIEGSRKDDAKSFQSLFNEKYVHKANLHNLVLNNTMENAMRKGLCMWEADLELLGTSKSELVCFQARLCSAGSIQQ